MAESTDYSGQRIRSMGVNRLLPGKWPFTKVIILGRDLSRQMEAMFTKDLAASNAIVLERWERRPPLLRLKKWAARLAEYWL